MFKTPSFTSLSNIAPAGSKSFLSSAKSYLPTTQSAAPSGTASGTASETASGTASGTASETASETASGTASGTASETASETASGTKSFFSNVESYFSKSPKKNNKNGNLSAAPSAEQSENPSFLSRAESLFTKSKKNNNNGKSSASPSENPSFLSRTESFFSNKFGLSKETVPSVSSTTLIALTEKDRHDIYDFLSSIMKDNNKNYNTLLGNSNFGTKNIIMYKYLINNAFYNKNYDLIQKCYDILKNLLSNKHPMSRYIYALICYIDIERNFYTGILKTNGKNLNINMNEINTLFKNGSLTHISVSTGPKTGNNKGSNTGNNKGHNTGNNKGPNTGNKGPNTENNNNY